MSVHDRLRTVLFVPATRPERFTKALDSGTDAVIIDLEDAVEHDAKEQARKNLMKFASENPGASFLVRVNDAQSAWFNADLALCAELSNVSAIVLPKAESAEQIARVSGAGKPIMPIVETALGVYALSAIAAAEGVVRLSFGKLDLMLDMAISPDTPAAEILLNQVKFRILLESKVHNLKPPIDSVYPDFSDARGTESAARLACDMGFGGMLCIHPAQVAAVHRAFMPSADELGWAERVVSQADASGSYAFKLDGKMVDLPVIERARHIVARARGQFRQP